MADKIIKNLYEYLTNEEKWFIKNNPLFKDEIIETYCSIRSALKPLNQGDADHKK